MTMLGTAVEEYLTSANEITLDLSSLSSADGLLAWVVQNPGSGTGVTVSAPSPWESAIQRSVSYAVGAAFYVPPGGTIPSSVTFSSSATGVMLAWVYPLTGVDPTVLDTSPTVGDSVGFTLTAPALTTVTADAEYLLLGSARRRPTLTVDAPLTEVDNLAVWGGSDGASIAAAVGSEIVGTPGEVTGRTVSGDESTTWLAVGVALRPVGAPPDPTYALTTNVTGNGTVTRDPNQAEHQEGATVTLTPVPDSGWVFTGWSGDGIDATNDTDDPLAYVMPGAAATLTATFVEATPLATPQPTVTDQTDPTTTGGTDGTATVQWSAVPGASSAYRAELDTGSGWTLVAEDTNGTEYTFVGLSAGAHTAGITAKP